MEVCVHGSSMASPAFQRLLFTALRALIDELGVATFNAGACGEPGQRSCSWDRLAGLTPQSK